MAEELLLDDWRLDAAPLAQTGDAATGTWQYRYETADGFEAHRLESKRLGVRSVRYLGVVPEGRPKVFSEHETRYGALVVLPPCDFWLPDIRRGRFLWRLEIRWTKTHQPDHPTRVSISDLASGAELEVGNWVFGLGGTYSGSEKFCWVDGNLTAAFEYGADGVAVSGLDMVNHDSALPHHAGLELDYLGFDYWQNGLALPDELVPREFPDERLERLRVEHLA